MQAGAVDYVTKPISAPIVKARVKIGWGTAAGASLATVGGGFCGPPPPTCSIR